MLKASGKIVNHSTPRAQVTDVKAEEWPTEKDGTRPPGFHIGISRERERCKKFQLRGAREIISVGTQKREAMWLRKEKTTYLSSRVG